MTRFVLHNTATHLEVRDTDHPENKPLFIDFLSYALERRRKYGGGHQQLLAKAVGSKKLTKNRQATLLDATTGFAVDAYVLATLGFQVRMLERSPIIGVLLQDALERAKCDPLFQALKLELNITDAIVYLQNLDASMRPDVIYLDPMYPERKKTALNKQNMRILKDIVGTDDDAAQLLDVALKQAKNRVVVKRQKLAPIIGTTKPTIVFIGKSCRYDVYIVQPPT